MRKNESGQVGLGIILLIAAIVGILLLWAGGLAFQYFTADVRGKVAANEDIKANPQRRIEAYERFFNQCADVQSIETNLHAQQAELKSTKDERRRGQLLTNINALIAARAEAVNQYNADSAKTYTAGQFKASNLPYRLPTEAPTEGNTECAA